MKKETNLLGDAGIVPYIIEGTTIKMLFMQSTSNPDAGWQITKGHIDEDEDTRTAALREAHTGMGLFEPNCSDIKNMGNFGGMTLYAATIINKELFGDPDINKTARTKWLTLEEFEIVGRLSQRHIIKQIHNSLTG